MHAFDRQTDGQTDRILIARPRLHFIQRSKNCRSPTPHLFTRSSTQIEFIFFDNSIIQY